MVIRDIGLRSSLIARLSLAGESLLTIDCALDDIALVRAARPPAILIVDAEIVGAHLTALCDRGPWDGIIVLAQEAEPVIRAERVCIVKRKYALAQITATLTRWRPAVSPHR